MNTLIASKPWETRTHTYIEWSKMDYDWKNHYKIEQTVVSYLWRYNNYLEGLKNPHIMKSTFGLKNDRDIKEEIAWWFNRCIGAHNTITFKKHKHMKIYLIKQDINTMYDTYDSAVVVAESEDDARTIHPSNHSDSWSSNTWVLKNEIDKIEVTYIGEADITQNRGVILASFNAG